MVVTMRSRRRHSPGGCTDDSTTSCTRTPVSRPRYQQLNQASGPQPSAADITAQIVPSGALRAQRRPIRWPIIAAGIRAGARRLKLPSVTSFPPAPSLADGAGGSRPIICRSQSPYRARGLLRYLLL